MGVLADTFYVSTVRAPFPQFKVLIVEDDETAAMLVGGALAFAGANVVRVRTHAEAIAEFQAHHYDAVVSDMLTPRGTVEDFLRIAVTSARNPRVVLMSALSAKALDNLASTYDVIAMAKPVDVPSLLVAVFGDDLAVAA